MKKKTKIIFGKFLDSTFIVALAMLVVLLLFLFGFIWQKFG